MIINWPQDKNKLKDLKAGDVVEFSGIIYTARDQAHLRLEEMVKNNQKIDIDFKDAFIYYAGPTPTMPGKAIGSIGPTTSSRMDRFEDLMTKLGVCGTIGKGPRDEKCSQYYIDNKILYFITTGGCGALLSKSVIKAEELMFKDLGCESIKRLEVKNFKMILAIDYYGNNLFKR